MRYGAAFLASALTLAGCADLGPADPVPVPPQRPEGLRPPPPPEPEPETPESIALREYYANIERQFLIRGLLRTDGGGPDTPYDAERLAETFLRLAFFEEYGPDTGVLIARETASRLHRWSDPVRIETRFGASIPDDVVDADTRDISGFAARLARASGHPISRTTGSGNFVVFIVNEAERRALGPELRRLAPGMSETALNSLVDLPRSSYCIVFAVDRDNSGTYDNAAAIIRAEHPDLLRRSCYHEEIAQGLGLANDSPRARPSIFNDDEEFALLTSMDEDMLKILYDPRLRPGMGIEEARPIVERIAAEIVPPES